MGIHSRLNTLQGDMMQIRSQLRVIEMMSEEDRNNTLSKIIDAMNSMIVDVSEIKQESNTIHHKMNELLDQLL